MDEKQDAIKKENRQAALRENNATRDDAGAGRKVGLYGCGFLILAAVIIFIILVLTGIYNPFQGTEGVGP